METPDNLILHVMFVIIKNAIANVFQSIGCFGLIGPLRQYFNLYRVVSQREREKEKRRGKMSKQQPPAPTASTVGPCPPAIQIGRTPRHRKFTQHHRTTRPFHYQIESMYMYVRSHLSTNFFWFDLRMEEEKLARLRGYKNHFYAQLS